VPALPGTLKTSRRLTTCSPAQALRDRRRQELFQQHRQGFTQLEPVAGGVCEEESALNNKASSLDSSSESRSFSFFSSFQRFSLSSSRFSLASDSILNLSVSRSMSYTGRQFNIANKRRQGGNVETHSDLVSCREASELEEVVIAVVRRERDQKQQGAGKKG
jgi:hypothetical protein